MPKMDDEKPVKKKIKADEHKTEKTEVFNGTVRLEKSVTRQVDDGHYAKVSVAISLPIDYTDEHLTKAKKTIRKIDIVINDEIERQLEEME